MSNAERLIEALAQAFPQDDVEMGAELIDAMIAALEPITAPDFVTVMAGPDDSFSATWEGADGMRDAWADWLDSFGRVRFEIQTIEQVGDNVITVGRQVGTTRQGGVEIEQTSAAVWKFREDRIVRVEFHLDREKAEESAREAG